MQRTGLLFYDGLTSRYDIIYEQNGDDTLPYFGGLHCGDCLDVLCEDDSWLPCRIEYDFDEETNAPRWYLTSETKLFEKLDGLKVRT